MKQSPIAEFAQYRFVRGRDSSVITLPAQGIDERNLLVLDCERWGLARLHIFEEAAKRKDKLEAFQDEMKKIALMRSRSVVRVTSWGRDDEELFYASEMQDGEPLPAYLERTGGVPFAVVGEWIDQFIDLLESVDELTPSFQRFTTLNFQVILDRFGVTRPVFSEFYGWTRPGVEANAHAHDWYLAQIFCSMMVGVPVRTFHARSLPRNFEDLDEPFRTAILDSLEERTDRSYMNFKSAMKRLAENADAERCGVALPLMPVREWFREDLAESYDYAPDYELPETVDSSDERYAVQSRIRGKAANIQILPGRETLPREGWLNQHHDATRRPGRGTINQVQVNYVEDRGSLTLVGEECVEGVDLASLVREGGTLSEADAKTVAAKVSTAMDLLEKNIGSCSVWWLPPENVFLLTGTRDLAASAQLIERKGSAGWAELPLKLRLHQTTATLKEGVNLPGAVRRLSREPGRGFRAASRSAVALPLVWRLLVGTRLQWGKTMERVDQLSPGLLDLFEDYRNRLRDAPEELETDLFEALRDWAPDEPGEKPAALATAEVGDEALEAAFDATLFDGRFDTKAEPEKESEFTSALEPDESIKEAPMMVRTESDGGAAKTEHAASGGSSLWWVWAAVTGIVAAAAFGYFASDWNTEQSVYAVEPEIEFPQPEFVAPAPPSSQQVITELQGFLLEEGGPQNLKLLHLLEVFDFEANRIAIENVLRAAAKERNSTAALLMAELSRTRGKAPEVYRPWLLEAARMGDGESRYRYANEILSNDITGEERAEAIAMLGLAAAEGHDPGREMWAVTVMDTDSTASYEMIRSAAGNGIPSAIFTLGLFQAQGIGTKADKSAAAASFRKAAELGEVEAMYWYARCLEVGYGVGTSFTEAQRWMKNAASIGYAEAEQWCGERDIPIAGVTGPTGLGE